MTNLIEPVRKPASGRRPMALATGSVAAGVGALRRGIAPIIAWARLTGGSLRLAGPDAIGAIDPQIRGLLWHVLVDVISAIGVLGVADGPLETAVGALNALSDRARAELASSPPRAMASPEVEPPQIFVLEILQHDLQPCLGRWTPRLARWRTTGRPEADWPLHDPCRGDLARTRERLVERAWQLGMALGLSGLERLLPARPAVAPVLIAAESLAEAEAAIATPPEATVLSAGWQIYVEAVARIPASELASGPGVLGEAIAALEMLADATRAGLKAMSPPSPDDGGETVQALGLRLLNEGLQPFLAEWRPRYRRFAASERPEAKWGRAEACRAALAATIARCHPTIRALGRKVGAPSLPAPKGLADHAENEAPLQLPPPLRP
jgi:hypothetical protein